VFFGDYYASKKEQILRDVRDYEEKIKNKIDMFEESLKEPKHMENSPNPKTPKTNKRGDFITMDHQLSRYDNEKSVLSRIGRRISHSFKRDLKSNKQDGVENAEDRAKHLE